MSSQKDGSIPTLLYSFDTLSIATSINTGQLRADAKAGKLKGRRIGRRWIFAAEDVADYIKSFPYSDSPEGCYSESDD